MQRKDNMEIFKLFGTVMVNTDKANKSISKTGDHSETLRGKLGKGIKTAAKYGAAFAAAGAAVVGAMVKLASKTAAAGDEIDKNSQKLGISRQTYQELKFVMSQCGMDIEKFKGGMKKLTNTVYDAVDGNEEYAAAFDKIGVKLKDSNGDLRDQEDIMWDTISGLQGMTNQTEKAALANELFGKAGAEMMPLLNQSSGSIEEMRKQAEELGIVLDDKTIDASVKFTDTMDQAKRAFDAIVIKVGAKVMPIVQKMLDWVIEHIPEIGAIFSAVGKVVGTVVKYAMKIIRKLIEVFDALFSGTKGNAKVWKQLWHDIKKILKGAVDVILGILQVFIDLFNGDWDALWKDTKKLAKDAGKLIANIIKLALMAVVAIIKGVGKLIKKAAKAVFGKIGDGFKAAWTAIKNWVVDVFMWLPNKIKKLGNLKDVGKAILKSLLQGFKDIWNNIKDWVKDKVEWIKEKFTGAKDEAKNTPKRQTKSTKHAVGLNYVPYDGYSATLHEGEKVLTKAQAQEYDSGSIGGSNVEGLLEDVVMLLKALKNQEKTISLNKRELMRIHNEL